MNCSGNLYRYNSIWSLKMHSSPNGIPNIFIKYLKKDDIFVILEKMENVIYPCKILTTDGFVGWIPFNFTAFDELLNDLDRKK